MSLEIVDLDESSTQEIQKEFEPPKRKYNDLPYLRKDFIKLIKPMQEKVLSQQRQIDQGNEQIQILLHQLGKILQERATYFRRIVEIREFFNDKQNKRYKINMTKKEIKAKLEKCENILETTINQKELIKADALNNMALCAQQRNELSQVESEYQVLSSVVNNSVNYSVKEKIVQLNVRLENFHVLTDEYYHEKLNSLEIERNTLLIKLMEKNKQEENAKRLYKKQLLMQKEEEKQPSIPKEAEKPKEKSTKNRNVNVDNRNKQIKRRPKTAERDVELIRTKKQARDTKIKQNTKIKRSNVNDEDDNEYDSQNDREIPKKQKESPKKIKRIPQTTKETIRTRKPSNRKAYYADSDDDYDDEERNCKQISSKKSSKSKARAKSPKPRVLKKILDEEKEEVKTKKKTRSKSATIQKKKHENDDYNNNENVNTSKTKTQKRQNSPQKRVQKTVQKTTKRKNVNRRKKE